jgi:hypothetical protein
VGRVRIESLVVQDDWDLTGLDQQTIPKRGAQKKRSVSTAPTEHEEQVKVVRWCANHSDRRAALIYSHLNGLRAPLGAAIKAKASGGRKGLPDLFLPVASGDYHGLYIEMKRRSGGVVSAEQKGWAAALSGQGYRVEFCKGHEAAIAVIQVYLSLSNTDPILAKTG